MSVTASPDQLALRAGIVQIVGKRGREDTAQYGTGVVVSNNRISGYVVTHGSLVARSDTVVILTPDGEELPTQTVRLDGTTDIAVLKVNGLPGKALGFAATLPAAGDVVWTAFAHPDTSQLGLAKGTVYSTGATGGYDRVAHSAIAGAPVAGVLINDCGEISGFSGPAPVDSAGRQESLAGPVLRDLLESLSLGTALSPVACLSEVAVAREKAEQAASQAAQAQLEAARAQSTAEQLLRKLGESDDRNKALETQSRDARLRAEDALASAARAEQDATRTRAELENTTTRILQETQAMVRIMEESRDQTEERLEVALRQQSDRADENQSRLMMVAIALGVVLAGAMLIALLRRRRDSGPVRAQPLARRSTQTETAEYVLDGRDEDGIRYLLRISGDQLADEQGVVIGRNPQDSPYIINHSDVSRKHARIRLVQSRVFIEDLGSTNGTLVNGQAIEDKGPVVVGHGDQIAIGSVVMKLRVLES